MGPDYTHWHGMYEVSKHFYQKFLPEIIKAAKDSYDEWGYGLSSVRFICGTQKIHKELEAKIRQELFGSDTKIVSDEEAEAIAAKLVEAEIVDDDEIESE